MDEARRRVLGLARAPFTETVALEHAVNRVLAASVRSTVDQPPFDTAAMDGWAVNGDGEGLYRIVGESRAGARFGEDLAPREAVLISTGAPMPEGASRVVRWEEASLRGALVQLPALRAGRQDIRFRGEDFAVGRMIAEPGRRIDHLDLARLAAAGVSEVPVAARPKVIVVPTGDELVPAGTARSRDQISDAVSLPLAVRCRDIGALVEIAPIVRDDACTARRAFGDMACDVVVVIGGASKGKHDIIRQSLSIFGLQLVVPSVQMRPGKPFWAGHLADGRLVVGLPGNPVAALVCAEVFLVPLLRAWQGAAPYPPVTNLSCSPIVQPKVKSERFVFAHLAIGDDGRLSAIPIGSDDSAAHSPLTGANALLRVPSAENGTRGACMTVSLLGVDLFYD